MRLRLVGVRLSGLVHGNYQIDLFQDTEETLRLYQAMGFYQDETWATQNHKSFRIGYGRPNTSE